MPSSPGSACMFLPQPFPLWTLPKSKQWEKVLHLAELRSYAAHDAVVESHTAPSFFYYLYRGKIRCEQQGINGNVKVCYYVKSGSLFGECLAVSATPSYARVVAVEASDVYAFPVEVLYSTIAPQYPDLMLNLLELVVYKVRMYSLQLYSTTLNDVGSQICRILYQIITQDKGEGEYTPNFTQQDIADVLGLHRNTVVRALRKLKDEGIIAQFSRNKLKVQSIEALLQRSMAPQP